MSRDTITATAAILPRPTLYGIGAYRTGSESREFAIGWDDYDRDTDWAASMLQAAGLGSGDLVVVTSLAWQNPWFSPVVRALRRIGATYMPAELYGWDARRVSMFLQRLPVKAVLGLGAETLTALSAAEPPVSDLLQGVEIIWARQDALSLAADFDAYVAPIAMLGPALAMGIPGRAGALVNAREWTVDALDGELLVSSAGDRATAFDRAPTGIRGAARSTDRDTVVIDLESLPAG